jgi:hypothetical protein
MNGWITCKYIVRNVQRCVAVHSPDQLQISLGALLELGVMLKTSQLSALVSRGESC